MLRFVYRAYMAGAFVGNISADAETDADARTIILAEHDYVTNLFFDHAC